MVPAPCADPMLVDSALNPAGVVQGSPSDSAAADVSEQGSPKPFIMAALKRTVRGVVKRVKESRRPLTAPSHSTTARMQLKLARRREEAAALRSRLVRKRLGSRVLKGLAPGTPLFSLNSRVPKGFTPATPLLKGIDNMIKREHFLMVQELSGRQFTLDACAVDDGLRMPHLPRYVDDTPSRLRL